MTYQEYKERKHDLQHRMDLLLQAEVRAEYLLNALGCDHCDEFDACTTCKHTKLCDASLAAGTKRADLYAELSRLYRQRREEERRCNA